MYAYYFMPFSVDNFQLNFFLIFKGKTTIKYMTFLQGSHEAHWNIKKESKQTLK